MRYNKNESVLLEPEHESLIFENDTELGVEPVRVILRERIHNHNKPFVTYWEIEYVSDTPNHSVGEMRIVTESLISNNEVPRLVQITEDEEKSENKLLAEPNK